MIDGQPLACFQPFIDTATGRIAGVEALGRLRQADGRLESVGPLFADPRTNAIILRRLDRQLRDDALRRLHEAPSDWFLSLNISPRWISRLRPRQPLVATPRTGMALSMRICPSSTRPLRNCAAFSAAMSAYTPTVTDWQGARCSAMSPPLLTQARSMPGCS